MTQSAPDAVRREEMDTSSVEKEREILREKALAEGKPEKIVPKIVEGRLNAFFKEVVLLEQPFVMDPSKKIKELLGDGAKVHEFVRWQIGETD